MLQRELELASIIEQALLGHEFEPEVAHDLAFHMTDWLDNLQEYSSFCSEPEVLDSEAVVDLVMRLLAHVPYHMKAAERLLSVTYDPSQDELEVAPVHVQHEMQMLLYCGNRWLAVLQNSETDAREGTALLDSFILHARNMYDYLRRRSSYNDDIVAGHFVPPDLEWNVDLSSMRELYRHLHKYRHHLTYSRGSIGRTSWGADEVRSVMDDIDREYRAFIGRLPEEQRASWEA